MNECELRFIQIDAPDCTGMDRIDFQLICIKQDSKRFFGLFWNYSEVDSEIALTLLN